MRNFKATILCLSALLIFAACGKKNKSGGTGGAFPNMINPIGTPIGLNPQINFNSFVGSVTCMTGITQRIGYQRTSPSGTVAYNASYVGVTAEGDLAFMTAGANGLPTFTAYICARPNMTGQEAPNIFGVVPNRSLSRCPFDELVATMDIAGYRMAFYPLHLSQWGASLGCR